MVAKLSVQHTLRLIFKVHYRCCTWQNFSVKYTNLAKYITKCGYNRLPQFTHYRFTLLAQM